MKAITILLIVGCCLSDIESQTVAGDADSRGRSTAVALNYCRASFHRIKRNASKAVLLEEQEKILNNLNLNGIADQEVVTLYSKVLEEIGGDTMAEQERKVLKTRFRQDISHQAMSTAFLIGTQASTLQFGQAVLTGAGSWWDYRLRKRTHNVDMWKIDKVRMTTLMTSSSKFLDTFWKMAQKKNIPDRWLIRSVDLDKLNAALEETDPTVRLRLLQRLEKFMESYPPYWYHLGRTQQAMGQLNEAAETYKKLVDLGIGHFRRDEMLAAGLANLALIQDYQHKPEALRTAREALTFANTAWQANLVCARILARHGQYEAAEEAILRNLDAKLERKQSLIALVSLYQDSGNRQALIQRLRDQQIVGRLPAGVLLRACSFLGSQQMPSNVAGHLVKSFYGYAHLNFGKDDVILLADPFWQLQQTAVALYINDHQSSPARISYLKDKMRVRFAGVSELGGLFAAAPLSLKLSVSLQYAGLPPVRLNLRRMSAADAAPLWKQAGQKQPWEIVRRGGGLLISHIDIGTSRLALLDRLQPPSTTGTMANNGGEQFLRADAAHNKKQRATTQPGSKQAETPANTAGSRKPQITIESITPVSENTTEELDRSVNEPPAHQETTK